MVAYVSFCRAEAKECRGIGEQDGCIGATIKYAPRNLRHVLLSFYTLRHTVRWFSVPEHLVTESVRETVRVPCY